ncbi:hypothetical protein [Nibrella saemangeumensis]
MQNAQTSQEPESTMNSDKPVFVAREQVTLVEEIEAVTRLKKLFEGALPTMVKQGRYTDHQAHHEIECLNSAIRRLKGLKFLLSNIDLPF